MSHGPGETPHMNKGACIVLCEPELQEMVGNMGPAGRRALALKLSRFIHQLYVTSDVIEAFEKRAPWKPKRVRWLAKKEAESN